MLYPLPSLAKKEKKDVWQTHETLTNRLSAEWYKIGVLKNDLESISDILRDLRDFELFPEKITKLYESKIVTIDKEIEKKEEKVEEILTELNKLRAPLSDAIAILREMVIGEAVKDMFTIIEQGDMKRISKMLSIKHDIDALWKEVDHLLNYINSQMGLEAFKIDQTYGMEKEFFDIIKANLGQQADDYYNKLNIMKDSLITRAGGLEKKKMYKIERHHIIEAIKSNKLLITKRKLLNMKKRYKEKRHHHELNILSAKVFYSLGDYHSALETIDLIPQDPAFSSEKVLYTVQSWYALEEYEKIWQWGKIYDLSILIGDNRNLVIWLVMESGFNLNKKADFSRFAGQMEPQNLYSLHIFHILARSYIKNKQLKVALSIFKKALQKEPEREIDKPAYNKILLANAQTLFEIGEYRNALDNFFMLLNKGIYFEEALFGIAWCYIKLEMYKKAETALRKLINQSPESPYSAEAILTMTKRFVNKAQYEWNKTTYLAKEEKRVEDVIKKLSDRIKNTNDKENVKKYKSAYSELTKLLKQIKSEKREDHAGITSYFQQALNICNLVSKHYETGSFQEISFSEKRENILHKLDSLVLAIKNEGQVIVQTGSSTKQQRLKVKTIKKLVDNSYVLSAEMQLSRYKWEKEYLDWKKMLLSDREKQIDKLYKQEKDTVKQQEYRKQKALTSAKIDFLVGEDNKLHEYWYDKLSTVLAQLVETPLESGDEIYLRYHLGELYYKDENREFARAYEKYEKGIMQYDSMMVLFNEGTLLEMPLLPEAPVLSHNKSIRQFKTNVLKYPSDSSISSSKYSLAWCYNDLGMFDSAVTKMADVAINYKSSQFAPQAWMFLGEYHFDNAKLDSAINAYKTVIKYPESEWFDDALYKLAWSHYRLSNPDKAISSFLALVDLGKKGKSGKALLETESLDYIAISFSESDITGEKGLKRAKAFCKKIGDDEKSTQILHRLAKVYEEQGRHAMAEKSYNTLLKMYPDYKNSPLVESDLLAVKTKDMTLEEANSHKINFFKKYNRKSPWAMQQPDSKTVAVADSAAESRLYDASITYHQIALQKNDTTSYNRAISTYRDFIHYYPTSPQANECHYNLAEILFSTGDYYKAAEEYIAVSKRYPGSKYRETAAWNAIVASQNLLKQEGHKK